MFYNLEIKKFKYKIEFYNSKNTKLDLKLKKFILNFRSIFIN